MSGDSRPSARVPLLGQLAGEGWFVQHGEVAATWALTRLASEPHLRAALVDYLGHHAGVDLSPVERVVAESVHDDSSRPDIEMLDSDGHTVALVEAKFEAELTPGQLAAYLAILQRRSGSHDGALFVLVPPSRTDEAQRILAAALESRDSSVRTAVVTWEDWIGVWERLAAASHDDELTCDLVQLKAMCRTLGGLVVPALEGTALGEDWRTRADDLVAIVKQVTRRHLGSCSPRELPMQGDLVSKPYAYRYLPRISEDAWVQVGVFGSFADEGMTPFWLMLHKDDNGSGGFGQAASRIATSEYARSVRRDDGHVWVPLSAPRDASGSEVVDSLVAQVDDVLAVVSPRVRSGDIAPEQ